MSWKTSDLAIVKLRYCCVTLENLKVVSEPWLLKGNNGTHDATSWKLEILRHFETAIRGACKNYYCWPQNKIDDFYFYLDNFCHSCSLSLKHL
jgi:hypothetical protein